MARPSTRVRAVFLHAALLISRAGEINTKGGPQRNPETEGEKNQNVSH